ncbi:hypothetical protein GQ600_395 [Phytophthora cactorum]|nr:hypothetical protein GQ600_395 [Phytophthora cactorum]
MRSPIHRDLLASVLNVYGRSLANVVVLIGDNCPTNKAAATLVGVTLLGCFCHKLNLGSRSSLKRNPARRSLLKTSVPRFPKQPT